MVTCANSLLYRKISEKHDKVFVTGCQDPALETNQPRANAAFVVLARNKELEGVLQSLKSVERHFNRWFHYPYVFLNDGDFNSTFKDEVRKHVSANVEFGKIDSSMWGFPDWVDHNVAKEGIRKQGDAAIMYGGMESYHHMCRFYSGYAYKPSETCGPVLTFTVSSTSTSCSRSTIGTGVLSPRSSTSAISPSMSCHSIDI